MTQEKITLKVAILDDRVEVREAYRDAFSRASSEETIIISSEEDIYAVLSET